MSIQLRQWKDKQSTLRPPYDAWHMAVLRCGETRFSSTGPLIRKLSAYYWHREQGASREIPEEMPSPEQIYRELQAEARALASEYGGLVLQGFILWLGFMAAWLFLQLWVILPMRLTVMVAAFLCCTALYPVAAYTYWNGRSVHPFKRLKLSLMLLLAAASGVFAFLSVLWDWQNPILRSAWSVPFNITYLLILINIGVFTGFVIHYRRANLLAEITTNGQSHLIAFSGLPSDARQAVNAALSEQDAIPLKTQIRRRLKAHLIAEAQLGENDLAESGAAYVLKHCVVMDWLYWSGCWVQWGLVLLVGSKLVWAVDGGLLTAADYFRQNISTGAVLGAFLISGLVLCPMNYVLRQILYLNDRFGLRQVWVMGALVLTGVGGLVVSGLTPSRFQWGTAINPISHPYGLLGVVGLVLVLQFLKGGLTATEGNEN